MKKLLLLLLCALPALSLCACSSEYATVYTVETSDGPLTVDNEHNTISDGENTYTYSGGYGTAGYDLEITYPDGSTWSEASTDGISHTISFSDDYVHGKYTDGGAIVEAILHETPREMKWKNPLPSLLLLGIGILSIASPRLVWYLSYGWHYKDAEPSDLALFANRAGGALAVVLAVIIFFM
mgnify:FL=1